MKNNPKPTLCYKHIYCLVLTLFCYQLQAQLRADFSLDRQGGCAPFTVAFTNRTVGASNNATYEWNLGNGNTSALINPGAIYTDEKIYSVTLTVKDGSQTSTKTSTVTVYKKPTADFTVAKPFYCMPESVVLNSTSVAGDGNISSYYWDFGDGNAQQAYGSQTSHNYNYEQKPTISLTVTNNYGCVNSVIKPGLVEILPRISPSFTVDRTVLCNISESVQFTNNSTGPGVLSYSWNFGDNTSSPDASPAHTYAQRGTYQVRLTASNAVGCSATSTQTTSINVSNFNSDFDVPSPICKDNYVYFNHRSAIFPDNSFWEFGDGRTGNWRGSASHYYTTPGTYTVKATHTYGTCKEVVTKTITVNEVPALPGFISDLQTLCGSPAGVQFRDTTSIASRWLWTFHQYTHPPAQSTDQAPSYIFNQDGIYNVGLRVTTAAGCTKDVMKQITIRRPSVAIFLTSSSSSSGASSCGPVTIRFGYNTSEPLSAFHWNFGDGNTSTDATPEHRFNNAGTYIVRLQYTTINNCTGTTDYTVRVYSKPVADFDYQNLACSNTTVQFINRSNVGTNWQWQFGDGNINYYQHSPSHQYSNVGNYAVRLITFNGPCSDTITKTINASTITGFVKITKADKSCGGTRGTVQFDQRSLRATGVSWNFGDGTIVPYDTSNHTITHTYTRTGTFIVTLTATYGSCMLTDYVTVNVLLKQSPVLTANRSQLCQNESINITINNLPENPNTGNVQYYQYAIKDIEYSDGTKFTNSYSFFDWNYTTYSKTLYNIKAGSGQFRAIIQSSGCLDTTNFVPLAVNGAVADFKITANNICYKTPFIFENTSKIVNNQAIQTWQWDFGDGNSQTHTNGNNVTHKYSSPGNYQVRLTVTDASGCRTTTSGIYANARGPKADFTPTGLFVPNVPLNTTVTFNNNTNYWYSNAVNYQWDFGDGRTSTSFTGSNTYTTPGDRTVQLIATDLSINCADTITKMIHVKDFNTAFRFTTAYLGSTSCPPVVVRINNLSVGYNRLKWDFGDGTISETQAYPTHTYTVPGTYKITLYTYGYNGLTGTYVDSVTVQAPSGKVTTDITQGCTSQMVNLKATAQGTSQYLWDMGDGTIKSGPDALQHYFATPGTYNPKLLLKNANGCTSSTELAGNVVIDELKISIKELPAIICNGAHLSFKPEIKSYAHDVLRKSLSYQWNFGTGVAGDTSDQREPSFTFNNPGTYTVSFKVRSPFGCEETATKTFTVHQTAKGAIEAINETCEKGLVQFKGTAFPAGNQQWEWDFGNGITSSQQLPTLQQYLQPRNYQVRLVVNRNGCTDTSFHTLTVHPKPMVNLSPKGSLICLGSSLSLHTEAGHTYAWTPATGLSHSTTNNPIASPLSTTTYKVVVTSNKGCTNEDSVKITVAQPFNMPVIPNAFICKGSEIKLTASGAHRYQWIENTVGLNDLTSPQPIARPTSTITYKVVGYDSHQCFTDTAQVLVTVRDLPTVNAGPDVELSGGESYQLSALISNDVVDWKWTPSDRLSCTSCPTPIAKPNMTTPYVVTVKNNYDCIASDTVVLKVKCAPDNVFIPNGFTPNKDGKNDLFYIKGSGAMIKSMLIYNRWGELVFERSHFEIDDASKAWDGTYKGISVSSGSYVYIAELECSGGESFIRKGTVNVIY